MAILLYSKNPQARLFLFPSVSICPPPTLSLELNLLFLLFHNLCHILSTSILNGPFQAAFVFLSIPLTFLILFLQALSLQDKVFLRYNTIHQHTCEFSLGAFKQRMTFLILN